MCGDYVRAFKSQNGYHFFLICDGMGSGKEAALASQLASTSLEKLLSIGVDAETAMKTVNSMLISSSDETFTTIDLLEIDEYTSKVRLIKAGSAPTYTVTGSGITKTEIKSMPIGIIDSLKINTAEMHVNDGDYIIMLSDGAISKERDEDMILTVAATEKYAGASDLAVKIYETIRENKIGSDDISVCVIQISKIVI